MLKAIFGVSEEIKVNTNIAETFGIRVRLEGYQVVVFEIK
jgi:hypothetical protein